MDTNIIKQVGINPTSLTAVPATPAAGASYDLSTGGWVVFGNKMGSADAALVKETIDFPELNETAKVGDANGGAPDDEPQITIGFDTFNFNVQSMADLVVALDSNKIITDGVTDFTDVTTYRTVLVEFIGVKGRYFPLCKVRVKDLQAGRSEDGTAQFNVEVTPLGSPGFLGGGKDYAFGTAT